MMIDVLELPESKRIIEAAEAQIFANTGMQVKLVAHLRHVEHDLEYKKLLLKKIVCKVFFTNWEDVLSRKRDRKIVSARFVYMYCLKKYFNETLENIAAQMNRDHTSVIHAIHAINDWYEAGDDIIIKIENVKNEYNDAFL
jgi:chromosomal replication initiation ATPase DnaA